MRADVERRSLPAIGSAIVCGASIVAIRRRLVVFAVNGKAGIANVSGKSAWREAKY